MDATISGHQFMAFFRHPGVFPACLLVVMLFMAPSAAGAAQRIDYELGSHYTAPHTAIMDAAWVSDTQFLMLLALPDSTEVRLVDTTTRESHQFMSASFIARYICDNEYAGRLRFKVSPRGNYLFFTWYDTAGIYQWKLVDISDAPDYRLKSFTPPEGMVISRALFSPDDSTVVLVHDAVAGKCATSLLVLDLTAGQELWRVDSGSANFIGRLWWKHAVGTRGEFYATIKLFQGEFQEHAGLALFSIPGRELKYQQTELDVMLGAHPAWGQLTCYAGPYEYVRNYMMDVSIPGLRTTTMELTSEPKQLHALPQPGLVLMSNTGDWRNSQLWLVDAASGDRWLVDSDCAGFDVAGDGKILVRGHSIMEIRTYTPRELLPFGLPGTD
jgi:hypothetical protein